MMTGTSSSLSDKVSKQVTGAFATFNNVCPKCGIENSPNTKFCKKCGNSLIKDTKFCAYCGTTLTSDAVFCTNCGKKVE